MSENVKSLFGGPASVREANDQCVAILERWLEMARSGEVVGVVVCGLHYDRTGSFELGGVIGGYSILGALAEANANVLDLVRS